MRIGVFDSGIGGITVLAELRKTFPFADFVYLGDTAHVPYGPRSAAQIQKLSLNCAAMIKERKVDVLVIACNTAASVALEAVSSAMHPVPTFSVVQPGIEASLNALSDFVPGSPILVLATRATVRSQAYGEPLRGAVKDFTKIYEQACPLLVPMIEEGWIEHPIMHQVVEEYVRPYLKPESKTGIALLGCTHYPWIHGAFEKALPGWKVINSASAVALSLKTKLPLDDIQTSKNRSTGSVEWIFTDPFAVPDFARQFISES